MQHVLDFVMTEHPAWQLADGRARRVFATDSGRWLATVHGGGLTFDCLSGSGAEPAGDSFTMPKRFVGAPDLAVALGSLGSVVRMRNSDLWDAIATSILRQVIRAAQAKKLYRTFSHAYGERILLPGGSVYSFLPRPETVLELSDAEFKAVGMTFNRRALRAAAEAFLESGDKWRELTPDTLVAELQGVPRVGPWTARAAVADWSNDWSCYPFADLAVRTWAKRAAPSYDWPANESEFGRMWRALAGEHLGSLTLLTLAWGTRHGDTD